MRQNNLSKAASSEGVAREGDLDGNKGVMGWGGEGLRDLQREELNQTNVPAA